MIFVTGDCHGETKRLTDYDYGVSLTKNDYVIVCGDFGYFPKSDMIEARLNALDRGPFTTLFIDGNHEDFHSLSKLKTETWMGGSVHFVRPSVIHLMRGELYTIDGMVFFAFGGARSMDLTDGLFDESDYLYGENDAALLEDIKLAERAGLSYRVVNKTWWSEELPSKSEMEHGMDNLNRAGKVDVILTHCAPDSIQKTYFPHADLNPFSSYLETIRKTVKFRKWFFGHYHKDVYLPGRFVNIYKEIIKL